MTAFAVTVAGIFVLVNMSFAVFPLRWPECNIYYRYTPSAIDHPHTINVTKVLNWIESYTSVRFLVDPSAHLGDFILHIDVGAHENPNECNIGYGYMSFFRIDSRHPERAFLYCVLKVIGLIPDHQRSVRDRYMTIDTSKAVQNKECPPSFFEILGDYKDYIEYPPISYNSILFGDFGCCEEMMQCIKPYPERLINKTEYPDNGIPTDMQYREDMDRINILYPYSFCEGQWP